MISLCKKYKSIKIKTCLDKSSVFFNNEHPLKPVALLMMPSNDKLMKYNYLAQLSVKLESTLREN